jgi:hypothetical protein
MGSSQKSIYAGRVRHGRAQYLIGAHPLFFLLSTAYRGLRQRPYLLGSLYALHGYLGAALAREPRFGDRDMVLFVQGYQLRALRHGKRAAAEWAFQQRRPGAQAAPLRGGG